MPKLNNTLLEAIPSEDIARLARRGEELLTQKYDKTSARYDSILRFPGRDCRSNEFIKLVYDMLKAFGANRGKPGGSLHDLADFQKSLRKHAGCIESLAKLKLETLKATDCELVKTISCLFDKLELVRTKSPLVTFSKTMHFLLPNLFMPIDRWYTLRFFYGYAPSNQKACCLEVFEQFREFAHAHSEVLRVQVDLKSRWNRSVPKVIDNVIIGYMSNNGMK